MAFIAVVIGVNLFAGPMSAEWAMLATVFVQQRNRKAGPGRSISMMLPRALAIGVACSVLLVPRIALGIPPGVEGPLVHPP